MRVVPSSEMFFTFFKIHDIHEVHVSNEISILFPSTEYKYRNISQNILICRLD